MKVELSLAEKQEGIKLCKYSGFKSNDICPIKKKGKIDWMRNDGPGGACSGRAAGFIRPVIRKKMGDRSLDAVYDWIRECEENERTWEELLAKCIMAMQQAPVEG